MSKQRIKPSDLQASEMELITDPKMHKNIDKRYVITRRLWFLEKGAKTIYGPRIDFVLQRDSWLPVQLTTNSPISVCTRRAEPSRYRMRAAMI